MPTPYFEQGGVTIYQGDCRELLPLLVAASVDLLLTDPPYGTGNATRASRKGIPRLSHAGAPSPRKWSSYRGDDHPFNPTPLLRFPKLALFGANHYSHLLPQSPSWIIWDKREHTTSDDFADCEMAWTNLGGPARMYRQLWRGCVCRGEENGKRRLHPSQKPVALMRWILERWTAPGDLILDPYTGSGTVLAAALSMGRRAIGIEIEERYCEVAARRCERALDAAAEVVGLGA